MIQVMRLLLVFLVHSGFQALLRGLNEEVGLIASVSQNSRQRMARITELKNHGI
jgi:hypothetical protein